MFSLLEPNNQTAWDAAENVMNTDAMLRDFAFDGLQTTRGRAPPQWTTYFSTIGITTSQMKQVITSNSAYFQFLDLDFEDLDTEDIQQYLKIHVLLHFKAYLPSRFREFSHKSFQHIPSWKSIISDLEEHVPQMLSKLYCQVYYNDQLAREVRMLAEEVRSAFRGILLQCSWMSSFTKVQAAGKLAQMKFKIGCPHTFSYLESVDFTSSSLFGNLFQMKRARHMSLIFQFNHPAKADGWIIPPFEPIAQYSMQNNDISLPLALLTPLTYDPAHDAAVNFGSLGFIIGHEMTHGYDSDGRHFDGFGNRKDWWMKADITTFRTLEKAIVSQYNSVRYYSESDAEGGNKFGYLTLGENFADIGGLEIAYRAFQIHLARRGKSRLLDGFTPEQRFFLAYAQHHAINIRKQLKQHLLSTDEHAPAEIRAITPISNMDEFYDAFSVNAGDPMYLPKRRRIHVWE